MSQPFILAIDEGTTNAKAIAVDREGGVIAKGSVSLKLTHPKPGWAEQDPEEIWQATLEAIQQCLITLDSNDLSGIAISNQRESIVMWERSTGNALSPLISWQCRRSQTLCKDIAQRPAANLVKAATGSVIDPLFPASKIAWLLDQDETLFRRAEQGEICFGTVDTWLTWKFTAGRAFVTDYSNASRYQLFNIHDLVWDHELLALYGIPFNALPEVISSSGFRGNSCDVPGIANGIPLLAQIGDSHAALYGHGGFVKGMAKATYGTGSSLMTRVDHAPLVDNGVCTTVAWHDGQASLALEGNITHSGSAIQYMSRLLGIPEIQQLSALAFSEQSNQGVYFVPALSGLGAPYWDAAARGTICGLTESATPATLARAAFESVVFQVADLFYAMQKAGGIKLKALSVDGGATQNSALMQLQADLLQVPIIRSELAEVSAIGAAYLAGKALAWWNDYPTLAELPRTTQTILPNPDNHQIQMDYLRWKDAVARARFQNDTNSNNNVEA
jgi:glycerol kinase